MSDVQELFDSIMIKLQKHASLEQLNSAAKNQMHLYHCGHVLAYKDVAEELVNDFGCVAKFIETKETP